MAQNLPLVDLTTNVSQIFTELYENYDILDNPEINVFENALYLEGNQSVSIKQRMEKTLIKYHEEEGTVGLYINPEEPLSDQVFVAGNGSTQLYKGLVYALATSYPDKQFLFVQEIPYFSGHRDAVNTVFDYPNATYQGYHHPSEVRANPGTIIVEFVTSPNNPNGEYREPQFESTPLNPYIIIGDFVFTSASFGITGDGYIGRNLEWLEKYRKSNTLILSYNSASKQFGHTGDRYGYMWFPMYNEFAKGIYNQLNNFLAITVGSNLHGPSNFLNLLKPLEKYGNIIRKDANESLKLRSGRLSLALLNRYPGSTIGNIGGSPTMFVKIHDSRIDLIEGVTAADVILEDTNVKTVPGSVYGANDYYVRINIMAFSEDLAIFANRLLGNIHGKDIYDRNSMIVSSHKCTGEKYICDNYVTNPGDKKIVVDGYHHNIRIRLPQYLGYEQPQNLSIKRSDNSCHKVKVKSDDFSLKLGVGGYAILRWSQPFYKDGRWEIIKLKHGKGHDHKHGKGYPTDVVNTDHPNVSHLYLV